MFHNHLKLYKPVLSKLVQRASGMELRPLQSSNINLVSEWLSRSENYQWLDFGNGIQMLSPPLLKLMSQSEKHCLRLYALSEEQCPVGLVGLSNIDKHFKTALLWYVLGDKKVADRGHTTVAVSRLLGIGFNELGLRSISAWAVEGNYPSIRVLEKNGFRYIGKQRTCHLIEEIPRDRLLFDLVSEEYRQSCGKAAKSAALLACVAMSPCWLT